LGPLDVLAAGLLDCAGKCAALVRRAIQQGIHLQIEINGEPREIEPGLTIARLLEGLELPRRYVAVERNYELVPRAAHDQCTLQEGDHLEIVTLVGGG
jgi:sulfur carrier protein